jgi:leucyl/phenylalanyl-tRNA--protein transferase
VALTHLQWRLHQRGYLLHDTQWTTPHLAMFGGHEIPCAKYLELLQRAILRKTTFV